jgi:hypothetical protein
VITAEARVLEDARRQARDNARDADLQPGRGGCAGGHRRGMAGPGGRQPEEPGLGAGQTDAGLITRAGMISHPRLPRRAKAAVLVREVRHTVAQSEAARGFPSKLG